MTRSIRRARWAASAAALATALVWSGVGRTQSVLPTSGSVASGTVTIGSPSANGAGQQMTITQSSSRAVVNFGSFSIGANDLVSIQQGGSSSNAMLARVTGSTASQIDGQLSATGQLYLVNPNGIVIGSGGQVSATGGFVASTLGITDSDFLAGRLNFAGSSNASVVNKGSISAGLMTALLGASVVNEGTISVPSGKVAIGAASSATLDFSGDGFLQVALPTDATDAAGRPLIDNSGTIIVNGGKIRIAASVAANAVRQAVNLNGLVQATSGDIVVSTTPGGAIAVGGTVDVQSPHNDNFVGAFHIGRGGTVSIAAGGALSVTGSISAEGDNAGRIDLTGSSVTVSNATLSIAGAGTAGLLRIGGAFRDGAGDDGSGDYTYFVGRFAGIGGDTALAAAKTTRVTGTTINAGATTSGTVIISSLNDTTFSGNQISFGAHTLGPGFNEGCGPFCNYPFFIDGALAITSHGTLSASDYPPLLTNPPYEPNPNGGGPQHLVIASGPRVVPTNGSVTSGVATFVDDGANTLTVNQTSDRAVLNWGSFLLGAGNTVQFNLPSATSAVLNRVAASGGRSQIDGTIASNGQVYLINPNGVTISSGGAINTAGFLASSLTLSDADFLNGTIRLTGTPSAGITNAGQINGGTGIVELAGGAVVNTGQITAGDARLIANGGGNLTLGGTITSTDLTIGAPSISIGGTSLAATGLNISTADALALIGAHQHVSLEAGDSLWVQDGLALDSGALTSALSLKAGRSLQVAGSIALNGASLSLSANDYGNLGLTIDRAMGFANLSIANASFVAGGVNGLTAQIFADSGNGSQLTLAPITTNVGNIALANLGAGSILFLGDITAPTTSLTLTGNLLFGADATLSARTLNWTNSATASVGGSLSGNATAQVSLVENGVTRFRGILDNATAARVDFRGLDSALAASFQYGFDAGDAAATAIRLTSGSLRSGDTLATLLAPGQFTVTTDAPGRLALGAHVVTISAPSGAPAVGDKVGYFFDLGLPSQNGLTIVPRQLTYSIAATSSIYGDLAAPTITLANLLGGDSVTGSLKVSDSNNTTVALGARLAAGTYALTLSGLSGTDAANYVLAASGSTDGHLTISPKAISLIGPSILSTYGDAATLSGGQLTGVLSGDGVAAGLALSIGGTSQQPTARLDAGTYAILPTGLTGASAANYTLGSATNGLLTVQPRSVTASAATTGYIYGSPVALVSLSNVLSGDNLIPTARLNGSSLALVANDGGFGLAAQTGVGSYSYSVIGLGGASAANYVLAEPVAGIATITPRPLNWSVSSLGKIYGDAASPTATLTGILFNDDVSGLVAAQGSVGPVSLGDRTAAGSYSLSVSGLTGSAAANYMLAAAGNSTGTLTIAPRGLSFAIDSLTSTYGTLAAPVARFDGVLAGDTVTGSVTASQTGQPITLTARSNAGSYALGFGSLSGADAGNYVIDGGVGGMLTIAPRTLNVTIGGSQSIYGTLAGAASISFANLLPGDDLTAPLSYSRDGQPVTLGARSNVGNYTTSIGALGGASAANYVLGDIVPGTLTIGPKAIGFSVANQQSVYGDTPAPQATLTGVLSGDDVSALLQLSGGGSPLALTNRTAAGLYSLAVTGLAGSASGNYSLSGGTSGQYSVTPRPLTYSIGSLSSVYGTLAMPQATLSNLLAGDSVQALISATLGGTTTTLGARTGVGSYALSVGGLTGGTSANYSLSATGNSGGTLTIAPRVLGLTGTISATYGTAASLDLALSGLLAGDAVSGSEIVTNAIGATITYGARTGVGSYSIALGGISGADAANYRIDATATGRLTISPLAISATSTALLATYGQIGGSGMLTIGAALSALAGDDVSALFTIGGSANVSGRLAAGSYGLTLIGSGLTGADAGNYIYASGAPRIGTLTVAPLRIGYSLSGATTNVYGDSLLPSAALTGVLSGDVVTTAIVAGTTGTLGSRTAVGTYGLSVLLGGRDSGNYVASGAAYSFTVTPRQVGLSAAFFRQTYGDITLGNALTGVLAGDQVTPTLSLTQSGGGSATLSATLNAGTYAAALSGLTGSAAGNYAINPLASGGTLTIDRRALTLGTINTIYGDSVDGSTLLANASGILTQDISRLLLDASVTQTISYYLLGSTANSYVSAKTTVTHAVDGTYRFLAGNLAGTIAGLSGAAAGNYALTSTNFTLAVAKRALSFTGGGTVTYGDDTVYRTTNILSGDAVSIFSNMRSASGKLVLSNQLLDVGTYTIVGNAVFQGTETYSPTPGTSYLISFANQAPTNYALASAPSAGSTTAVTIVQRPITYTIAAQQGAYAGASGIRPAVTLNNIVDTSVSGAGTLVDTSGAATIQHAGTYATQFNGLTGSTAGNYIVTGGTTASYTITPRIITPLAASYTYGDTPTLASLASATDLALLSADGATVSFAATSGISFASLNAGKTSYASTIGGANAGDFAGGIGTITILPRPIGYTIAASTNTYGTAVAYTAQLTNTLAGHSSDATFTLYNSSARGDAVDPLTSNARSAPYYLGVTGLTGELASNYVFTPTSVTTGAVTITPRPVTFYGGVTLTYDPGYGNYYSVSGAPYFETGTNTTSSGMLPGQTATATFDSALLAQNVGTYAYSNVTFSGSLAGNSNYSIRIVGDKLATIVPRTLSFEALSSGQAYGGSNLLVVPLINTNELGNGTANRANGVFASGISIVSYNGAVGSYGFTTGGFDYGRGSRIANLLKGPVVDPYANAGTYSYRVTGLSGTNSQNYVIADQTFTYTITPRTLTGYTYVSNPSITYGNSATVLNLSGANLMPFDVGQVTPVYASTSAAFLAREQGGAVLGSGSAHPLDVGTYSYALTGFGGARGGNYVLPSGSVGSVLTIAPRVLSVQFNTDLYYGNQTQSCDGCGMTANTKPLFTTSNQVAGTDVNASVLLSGNGASAVTYSAGLNAGTYSLATSLLGADAKNYVVDPAIATALTIKKAVIGFKIVNDNPDAQIRDYVQGVGYTGYASTQVTLNGVYGNDPVSVLIGLFKGADVTDRTSALYLNPDLAPSGSYHLQVYGVLANLDNYALAPSTSAWGQGVGVRVVNLDTLFGLTGAVPGAASIAAPAPIVASSAGAKAFAASQSNASASTSSDASSSSSAGAMDKLSSLLGFNPTNISSNSVGAASNGSNTNTLGGATNTNSGAADASAQYQVTAVSVTASASASASGEVRFDYGIGYSAVGGDASANASASISFLSTNPSIKGDAGVSVAAYALTGVAGSLGAIGDGDFNARAEAEAKAEASGGFALKDGKIEVDAKALAGAGASASAQGTLSGSYGSVGAGATIYSPGIVGGGITPTVGFSDGKLTFGINIAVALGFGGFDLDLAGAININALKDIGDEIYHKIGDALINEGAHIQDIGQGLTDGVNAINSILPHSCTGNCAKDAKDAATRAQITAADPFTDSSLSRYNASSINMYGVASTQEMVDLSAKLDLMRQFQAAKDVLAEQRASDAQDLKTLLSDPVAATSRINSLLYSQDKMTGALQSINAGLAQIGQHAEIDSAGNVIAKPGAVVPQASTPAAAGGK